MSRGKSFERDIKQAFERAGYLAYRNHDAMIGKGKSSVPSLPDLWAMHPSGDVLLIEAKVVKGKSLPFNRLADHQHAHLSKFDDHSLSFYGFVAAMYYGDNPRWKRAFLIHIKNWEYSRRHIGRKSLPLEHAEKIGTELEWAPAQGWQITKHN